MWGGVKRGIFCLPQEESFLFWFVFFFPFISDAKCSLLEHSLHYNQSKCKKFKWHSMYLTCFSLIKCVKLLYVGHFPFSCVVAKAVGLISAHVIQWSPFLFSEKSTFHKHCKCKMCVWNLKVIILLIARNLNPCCIFLFHSSSQSPFFCCVSCGCVYPQDICGDYSFDSWSINTMDL